MQTITSFGVRTVTLTPSGDAREPGRIRVGAPRLFPLMPACWV